MSAANLPVTSLTTVHQQFVAALPAMDRTFRFLFRRWPRRSRAEAIAAARAAARHAWHGLVRRGKDPWLSARPASPPTPPATSGPAAGSAPGPPAAARTSTTRRPAASACGSSASTASRDGTSPWLPTPGGSGWPRTTASARPTRRPSGSTSRAGWRRCRRGSGGPPNCWPRGWARARWRAASGSLLVRSARPGSGWPAPGNSFRARPAQRADHRRERCKNAASPRSHSRSPRHHLHSSTSSMSGRLSPWERVRSSTRCMSKAA
jgi:hypothetical protein